MNIFDYSLFFGWLDFQHQSRFECSSPNSHDLGNLLVLASTTNKTCSNLEIESFVTEHKRHWWRCMKLERAVGKIVKLESFMLESSFQVLVYIWKIV